MAVAADAFSNSSAGTTTRTWTHTPVGTPRAIIAFVVHDGTADDITGCTYGGTAMTEMTGSPNILGTGEGMVIYGYFLGASIPTGAQTVEATAGGTGNKLGYAISLTALTDTEIVDVDATVQTTSAADPSVTLALGGRTCFACIAFGSGQDAVTSIAPLTDWSSQNETDAGSEVFACYTFNTIGTTDVTAGWTQTAEDAVMIAVAVSEVAAAAGSSHARKLALLGVA